MHHIKNYLKHHIHNSISAVITKFNYKKTFLKYPIHFDKQILNQFKEKGFLVFPEVIPENQLELIKNEVPTFFRNSKLSDSNEIAYKRESAEVSKGHLTNAIIDFIKNNNIFSLIENYMNSKFLITNFVVKINHPTKEKMGPSNFHKDTYKHKSVHMMIYLTDVDENSGCFTYIPKSNNADLHSFKPTPIKKRISDEQISKFYKKTEWLKGKAGTILLVDANGLHAGPRWIDSNMDNLKSRTAVFVNFSTLPFDNKLRNFFYKQSSNLHKIFYS